jgi:amino acid transporter
MTNTSALIWLVTIQILAFGVGCTFIIMDHRIIRQKQQDKQRSSWYRRGLTITGILFLVPVIGQGLPETIISIVVFHSEVLPSSPDFNYQLYEHSLVLFTWLALLAEIVTLALVVYLIYLGITQHRR